MENCSLYVRACVHRLICPEPPAETRLDTCTYCTVRVQNMRDCIRLVTIEIGYNHVTLITRRHC